MNQHKKIRTILRRFSDLQDYQELLSPLGVTLSKASIFEFGIAENGQALRNL